MPEWAVYSQGNQVILHHPHLLPFKKGEVLTLLFFCDIKKSMSGWSIGQEVHVITTSFQHEGFWPKVGIERQSYIYRLLALHNLIIFTFRKCLKCGQSHLRKTTVSTVFWFCSWFLHRISLLKVMVRSELIWVDWITAGAHGYHTRLGLKVWNGWDDKMGGWDEGLLFVDDHVPLKPRVQKGYDQQVTCPKAYFELKTDIDYAVWNKVIYEFMKKKTVPTKAHYLAGFFFTGLDPDIKNCGQALKIVKCLQAHCWIWPKHKPRQVMIIFTIWWHLRSGLEGLKAWCFEIPQAIDKFPRSQTMSDFRLPCMEKYGICGATSATVWNAWKHFWDLGFGQVWTTSS